MADQRKDERRAAHAHRGGQHDGLRHHLLPTNMAKVGAISLLSWVVTALGSMAMVYGFAQAGIYNRRPGGLAAYAEDAST